METVIFLPLGERNLYHIPLSYLTRQGTIRITKSTLWAENSQILRGPLALR